MAHFESGTGVRPMKSRARCACHLKLGHYSKETRLDTEESP